MTKRKAQTTRDPRVDALIKDLSTEELRAVLTEMMWRTSQGLLNGIPDIERIVREIKANPN